MKSRHPAAALFGMLFIMLPALVLAESQSCDSRESVDGWGIWCGIEGHFERTLEQAPPQAGGTAINSASMSALTVDISDTGAYGGRPGGASDDPTITKSMAHPRNPVDLPISLPDGDEAYYRAAYLSHFARPYPDGGTIAVGIGTMTLALEDSINSRTVDVSVSGSDLGRDLELVDSFTFTDHGGDNRFIRVQLNEHEDFQGQFSAVSLIQQTRRDEPYFLKIDTIDGKEQSTKGNSENLAGSSIKTKFFDILKNYWVGSRFESFTTADEETGYSILHMSNKFVGGQLTPLEDMHNLISGNVTAAYAGHSHHLGQIVDVQVNFGTQTFTGSWSGGNLPSQPAADWSFTATGVVQERHIVATQFSEGVSGVLQGSFYQPHAQALGGAYDLQKVQQGNFNDTFSAVKVP